MPTNKVSMSVWNRPGISARFLRTKNAIVASIAKTTTLMRSVLVIGTPQRLPIFSAEREMWMPSSAIRFRHSNRKGTKEKGHNFGKPKLCPNV